LLDVADFLVRPGLLARRRRPRHERDEPGKKESEEHGRMPRFRVGQEHESTLSGIRQRNRQHDMIHVSARDSLVNQPPAPTARPGCPRAANATRGMQAAEVSKPRGTYYRTSRTNRFPQEILPGPRGREVWKEAAGAGRIVPSSLAPTP